MVTLTAIFILLRTLYVSCTPSTSTPTGFEALHLQMWPDNRILMCENSFKNAFLKDVIVDIAHTSPTRSRGLDESMVVGSTESRKFDGMTHLVTGDPDFSACG